MKYNEKYDRYIDNDYVVYRMNTKGKLVQCKLSLSNSGYLQTSTKFGNISLHRLIWETFNGEITDNMCIDHINTVRTDNRLENLRCVSRSENMKNPLTTKHLRNSKLGKKNPMYGKKPRPEHIELLRSIAEIPRTEFGKKFKDHFGFGWSKNEKLYKREWAYYKLHQKCRWE